MYTLADLKDMSKEDIRFLNKTLLKDAAKRIAIGIVATLAIEYGTEAIRGQVNKRRELKASTTEE